jgi:glucosamine-6-phosphate deaminase
VSRPTSTVTPRVFADPEELGRAAARLVADRLQAATAEGRPFLLGCPSGRSPSSTYAALAEIVAAERLDLGRLVIVMMDDYLVRAEDGSLVHEDERAEHSCRRFGREQIAAPLSAAAGPGRGIAEDHLWFPDPSGPDGYDDRISDAGGIDVFLLASGAGDGHVAFNAPGSLRSSRTRVVELPETTRTDNLATFPSFGGDLDRVPGHGVTVGVSTIADLSREVVLLLHGADKATAAARLASAEAYEPDWPATVFVECHEPHFFVDATAAQAAGLTVSPGW